MEGQPPGLPPKDAEQAPDTSKDAGITSPSATAATPEEMANMTRDLEGQGVINGSEKRITAEDAEKSQAEKEAANSALIDTMVESFDTQGQYGFVVGENSKDTSPLTPEQEKIQQTIDKLKQQNEQLGGKLLTELKSDTVDFYLINATHRVFESYYSKWYERTVNTEVPAVVGVDSVRGPMIISGGAAYELESRIEGSTSTIDRQEGDNVDNLDDMARNNYKGFGSFDKVQSGADLALFSNLHEVAIGNIVSGQRTEKTKDEYSGKALDAISAGDTLIAASKAS